MKKVSLLGAGSWGTALAIVLAKNGHEVTLWSAVPAEVTMLKENREHKDRLPGVKLPDNITISDDLEDSCKDRDLIVFSVASPYVRATAQKAAPFIKEGQIIVNVGKGIEETTLMTLSEILQQEIPQGDICVLSGFKPCRRGQPRHPDYRCRWCQKQRVCVLCAGFVYE